MSFMQSGKLDLKQGRYLPKEMMKIGEGVWDAFVFILQVSNYVCEMHKYDLQYFIIQICIALEIVEVFCKWVGICKISDWVES